MHLHLFKKKEKHHKNLLSDTISRLLYVTSRCDDLLIRRLKTKTYQINTFIYFGFAFFFSKYIYKNYIFGPANKTNSKWYEVKWVKARHKMLNTRYCSSTKSTFPVKQYIKKKTTQLPPLQHWTFHKV